MRVIKLIYIHGSIPRNSINIFGDSVSRMGGIFGGHILLNVSDNIYEFSYITRPIHLVPMNNFNGKIFFQKYAKFMRVHDADMLSIIKLNITEKQYFLLTNLLNEYILKSPYDYVFFGKRCFYFIYDLFEKSEIINKRSNMYKIMFTFQPKLAYIKLINLLKDKIVSKKIILGDKNRVWF